MKYSEIYDKDYYENGVCSGKSCYVNYGWMPEMTIKLAFNIIKHLNLKDNDKIIDYGCAKGYLVKAMRILDIEAFGFDVSSYAIAHVDSEVRKYCNLIEDDKFLQNGNYNWLISKDVLEHMGEEDIDFLLKESIGKVNKMFHVIPLGDGDGNFIVPEYHDDPSHIQIQNKDWWVRKFEQFGWDVVDFKYDVSGIKSNWTEKYKYGNGFFTLKSSST